MPGGSVGKVVGPLSLSIHIEWMPGGSVGKVVGPLYIYI